MDERFSIIRRIGKADYSLGDRINDYCHRTSGGPGKGIAWDKRDGRWVKWFRYSQIDIVRTDKASASSLETLLLSRIPTEWNDRDVSIGLKGNPIIYDARS